MKMFLPVLLVMVTFMAFVNNSANGDFFYGIR